MDTPILAPAYKYSICNLPLVIFRSMVSLVGLLIIGTRFVIVFFKLLRTRLIGKTMLVFIHSEVSMDICQLFGLACIFPALWNKQLSSGFGSWFTCNYCWDWHALSTILGSQAFKELWLTVHVLWPNYLMRNCRCYGIQFIFDRKLAIVTYYDSFIHLIYERSWTISIRQITVIAWKGACDVLRRLVSLLSKIQTNVWISRKTRA
jgi:hypothetical protein